MKHEWEFDGVVRLTKVGTAYILSTVVLAIAAVNTGNNALYIGVAFMLGCLLLSGMASKGGLKQLELEIAGFDEAWAGRVADGHLRIRNRSRLWAVRDVILVSDAFANAVLVPLVPRRGEVAVEIPFLFPRRGLARVSAIDSYTRYPFGFVLKKRRLRVSSEVVVLPRILEDGERSEIFAPASGDHSSSNRSGPGTEIHAFREFARGDSLRHVHWKKSASLGRWIMKQTAVETSRSVHVVVDPYQSVRTSDDDFEEMITAAATFVYHAVRNGLDVTLSLPRISVRAREGETSGPLMRALALLEPSAEPVVQLLERDSIVFSMAAPGGSQAIVDRTMRDRHAGEAS
ncbi:MAG TPA: DUF58 domain-containing protein [Thermoanaerobaculia bacterium]